MASTLVILVILDTATTVMTIVTARLLPTSSRRRRGRMTRTVLGTAQQARTRGSWRCSRRSRPTRSGEVRSEVRSEVRNGGVSHHPEGVSRLDRPLERNGHRRPSTSATRSTS